MYEQGMPSHLITDSSLNGQPTQEQKKAFEKNWKQKYGENRNINIPALTHEGVQVHKLGYDSVKELGLLESSQDGRRALANVFQVAAELFNDSVGSTFNNRSEARKEMWTDRIMVDHQAFYQGITNNILPAYSGNEIMRYVPDYSEVEELQTDKKSKAGWVSQMYQDGVINGDEYREMMEQDPVGDKHHQTYYINMNKIPADQALESDILGPTEDEEKAYSEMKINY
jgi:phage portal protein BeeE